MNAENRILTLDPELVADVHTQVEEWSEELLNPWQPSHAARGIVQTIKNSCPRMAEALEAAGIFEPWAEMLHDEILDLARDLRDREVMATANEAEHEARQHLLPWCWEMQEEWLEAHCIDYEPEPDPDLYGPDDPRHSQYEEAEEEHEAPILKFGSGELSMIQSALSKSIKALLGSNRVESGDVMCLGAMLSLVERLPRHHEGYSGTITLSSDIGTGVGWKSFSIGDDGLMLNAGEIIRGEWGSDSSSRTILMVTEKSSSSSDPFFDLEDWLSDFSNDAADADVTFNVDWFPEDEMPAFGENPHPKEEEDSQHFEGTPPNLLTAHAMIDGKSSVPITRQNVAGLLLDLPCAGFKEKTGQLPEDVWGGFLKSTQVVSDDRAYLIDLADYVGDAPIMDVLDRMIHPTEKHLQDALEKGVAGGLDAWVFFGNLKRDGENAPVALELFSFRNFLWKITVFSDSQERALAEIRRLNSTLQVNKEELEERWVIPKRATPKIILPLIVSEPTQDTAETSSRRGTMPAIFMVGLLVALAGIFVGTMWYISATNKPTPLSDRELKYLNYVESHKSPEVRAMEAEDALQIEREGRDISGPQDNRGHSDE